MIPAKASRPLSKAGSRIADGTYSILFGYFNRNMKQELDIPIGPENKNRTRRSGSGPAHSFFDAPPVGHVHRDRPEGFRLAKSYLDDHRQRRHHA